MESLGHYLLRDRIALPGTPPATLEAHEGQDVRTGISVLIFKPVETAPPSQTLPSSLAWIDHSDGGWVAEVPVGAVQSSWLAGRVEVGRLLTWTKQLVQLIKAAQDQDLPIGYIVPELIWARGSRVWLGGVGLENPAHRWDFAGLLNSLKVIAGDVYPALPWREALEGYATGEVEDAALMEALTAAEQKMEPLPVSSPALEALPASPAPPKPSGVSKSLKVHTEPHPTLPPPAPAPTRRIRIEERSEPPFEVLSPQPTSRRGMAFWLLLIPLLLLAGAGYLFVQTRPQPPAAPNTYPVEFRTRPAGTTANVVILEAPANSKLELRTVIAQIPSVVKFDQPGTYRVQIRVQGRSPKEALIVVPNPGGVTVSLQ